MTGKIGSAFTVHLAIVMAILLLRPVGSWAHCDTMDGPVVKAAQRALETGNASLVLIWVQKEAEPEIEGAFEKTLAVRKLSPDARELADRYFFETLVRVHRAGEGEPYTGLKPGGGDLGPVIPAADKAIAAGEAEPLVKLITDAVTDGLHRRYHAVAEAKSYAPQDLAAGRRYVQAYVAFLHYAEKVFEAAATSKAHASAQGVDTHGHP